MGSSKDTKKKAGKKATKKKAPPKPEEDSITGNESKPVSMRIGVGSIENLKLITDALNKEYGAKLGKVWQQMTWHDSARLIFDNAIEEFTKLGRLPRVSELDAEDGQ